MQQTRAGRWQVFYDPLSAAMVPLIDGVARKRMLRRGVAQRGTRLSDMYVNYYTLAAHTPTGVGRAASGSPTPILLVHGIGDSAATWVFLMRRLAQSRDVYAIDLPGHGFSGLPPDRTYISILEYRDLLDEFVHTVIGRPALVVGNSLGGMLAVQLAWADPEYVRGVALLNPGGAQLGGIRSWDDFFERIADSRLSTTWRASRGLIRNVPGVALAIGLRSIQRMFQRPVILEGYKNADGANLLTPEQLRRLPVPTALIWGLDDHFLPDGSLEFFHDNLPNAPKLLLHHCGHLPQRERPLSVGRFLKTFANEVELRQVEERTEVET